MSCTLRKVLAVPTRRPLPPGKAERRESFLTLKYDMSVCLCVWENPNRRTLAVRNAHQNSRAVPERVPYETYGTVRVRTRLL